MNKKANKNEKDESNENKTRMEISISEISQRIIDDIDKASLKNLSDAKYAKKILRLSDLKYTKKLLSKMENISDRTENSIEKRAVIQALLFSTIIPVTISCQKSTLGVCSSNILHSSAKRILSFCVLGLHIAGPLDLFSILN